MLYELKIAQDDLDLAVLDKANAVAEGLTIISVEDEDEDSLMGVARGFGFQSRLAFILDPTGMFDLSATH